MVIPVRRRPYGWGQMPPRSRLAFGYFGDGDRVTCWTGGRYAPPRIGGGAPWGSDSLPDFYTRTHWGGVEYYADCILSGAGDSITWDLSGTGHLFLPSIGTGNISVVVKHQPQTTVGNCAGFNASGGGNDDLQIGLTTNEFFISGNSPSDDVETTTAPTSGRDYIAAGVRRGSTAGDTKTYLADVHDGPAPMALDWDSGSDGFSAGANLLAFDQAGAASGPTGSSTDGQFYWVVIFDVALAEPLLRDPRIWTQLNLRRLYGDLSYREQAIRIIPTPAAAGGDISATAALTFGSTADLDATGALTATGALAFGSTADLDAIGAVTATAALAFGTTATLNATGAMTATGALAFGTTATLNATGTITATAAPTFGSTANLTSPSTDDISATAALAFGSTATLNAIGTVTATGAMAFGSTATLSSPGDVTATAALAFGSTATMNAIGVMAATGAMAFGSTAAMNAIGTMTATGALAFGSTANLVDPNATTTLLDGRTFTPAAEGRTFTPSVDRTFTPGTK